MTSAGQATLLARYFGLADRVALVTGGSGDIGGAIAHALAVAGASVMLAGRDQDNLNRTRSTIVTAGRDAHIVVADLAEVDACRAIVERTRDIFGGLDIVFNCAGVNDRQYILDVTPESYDRIMAVNLRAAYFVSQAAVPLMIEHGGGKIVHVGSLTSTIGLAEVSVYGASKAGLAGLAKTMAIEWAQYNIQVNCLAPGFIYTTLTEQGLWGNDNKRRWMLDRIPARRPGRPDDLVGAALFLSSPASDYMSGQTLTVDGGLLAGSMW